MIGDRRALPKLIETLDDNDLARDAGQALAKIAKTGERWDAGQWKAWWAEQKK